MWGRVPTCPYHIKLSDMVWTLDRMARWTEQNSTSQTSQPVLVPYKISYKQSW